MNANSTMPRYELTDETRTVYGSTLHRVWWLADGRLGGWIEDPACLPQDGTAVLWGDAIVLGSNARLHGGVFRGGTFCGGTFRGGVFWGGVFWDGTFRGGTFWGGVFRGGTFRGGEFRDGVFQGGEFRGGTFWGDVFWGGEFRGGEFRGGRFRGGEFRQSPCCAQRSDGYMFVAKIVDGELRIWAGCRDFSWAEAVKHWNDEHRHGAESQRIIHFLKAQAEDEEARWPKE